MTGEELQNYIAYKNRVDIERATMSYAQRRANAIRDQRFRMTMKALFFAGGFLCGVGTYTEIFVFLVFGVFGPIALKYDMI